MFLNVTHVSILTSILSSNLHRLPSLNYGTLRYHVRIKLLTSTISAVYLAPLHFPRKTIYLDQWAVTLSLKDGCFQAYLLAVLIVSLRFTLSIHLGALIGGLGFFPLVHGSYHSQTVCHCKKQSIQSLSKFSKNFFPLA